MFKKNSYTHFFHLIAIQIIFAGCSRESFEVGSLSVGTNPLEIECRVKVDKPIEKKTFDLDSLEAEDIIVSVNGYPLRKKTYDEMQVLKAKSLTADPRMNQLVAQKILEEGRINMIRTFVGQRLLVDNAFELGLVTTNDVVAHVTESLLKASAKDGKSVQKILKSFPGDPKYLYYELAVAYAMGKVIETKIHPYDDVSMDFTKAVQRQIEADNAAAEKTNQMFRARLEDWRDQIMRKKLAFDKIAKLYSQDGAEQCGLWGTFEEGEMDDKRIEDAVFKLKQGEMSRVLEDENGFHIVKVIDIIPPERNDKGRIVVRERRTLAHIYIEKLPTIIRQDDKHLLADLKNQFQTQEINAYIAGLQTNGVNTVIYPNGVPIYH